MILDEAAALPLKRGLIQPNSRGKVVVLRKTNDGSYHLISVGLDSIRAHSAGSGQESLEGYINHIKGTDGLVAEKVTFSLTPPYDERNHYQPYRVVVRRASSFDARRSIGCTSTSFEKLLREIAAEEDTKDSDKRTLTAPWTGVLITVQLESRMQPRLRRWRLPRILEVAKSRNTPPHERDKTPTGRNGTGALIRDTLQKLGSCSGHIACVGPQA